METEQGHLLVTFLSIIILFLMAPFGGTFGMISVSGTSLLCTGSIPVGKTRHLCYFNRIACMVYNSFNESFAKLILDCTESGKEFTEVGGIGIWITSLGIALQNISTV